MVDVDQIRLMRTKKKLIPQLLFNIAYTARNRDWRMIGKVESSGAIVALAIQNILYLHQMNGIDCIERNSLRSWHFPFFDKGKCHRNFNCREFEFACFGFESVGVLLSFSSPPFGGRLGGASFTTSPAPQPNFSFGAAKREFLFCFS